MDREKFTRGMGNVSYLNKIIDGYKNIPLTESVEKSMVAEITEAMKKRFRENLGDEYDDISDEEVEEAIASIVMPIIKRREHLKLGKDS